MRHAVPRRRYGHGHSGTCALAGRCMIRSGFLYFTPFFLKNQCWRAFRSIFPAKKRILAQNAHLPAPGPALQMMNFALCVRGASRGGKQKCRGAKERHPFRMPLCVLFSAPKEAFKLPRVL
ncbi:MAG: hypothetical protein HDT27_00440 [Subdoligranulum sp.]|nr:hypothetical protein [Subdoligranulum sp.]